MDGKDPEQGRSFFFKRKASRKTHNQEIQTGENATTSGNHLSAQVKSSTLPSNRQDHGACSVPPSPSGGLFSKLKRKFKIRSSRGKYDLKDVQPPRMRRKSDDPNVMKESKDEESGDMKVTSSVKTPRRSHSDKEDVILIRKDKRVSVLCKTGDREPEIIFSNMNSEDDESESFGDGGDEDPYATINSVKDEISEKFSGSGGKKKEDKSERDRAKARELLTKSMKEPFGPNGGILASPSENLEDLYAKIKPKTIDSKLESSDADVAGTPVDVAELNQLAEARVKSRLEPQYETLDEIRQRTSLMCEDDYEDLSHDSSVVEEALPSIPVDPDYETLDDVKQRVEQSLSSSSSKADTPTSQKQSSSHYSKLHGSKSSKLSESTQSTSNSSFSTTDRSPVDVSGASKDSKLEHHGQRESLALTKALPKEEKMIEATKKTPGKGDANQQTSKGPAPLAASTDSENETSSDSPSSECIYDNPNVILRKQMNRQSLSPLSPRSRRSCNASSLRTPAEEELVEKLSSLLAPPLPLRNYLKDEISRGAGSCRHSWASPSPKFWDMSESWHGTDFTKGGHLLVASADSKLRVAVKSKSQELFEGSKDDQKSSFGAVSKKVEANGSKHDISECWQGEEEVIRSTSSQCRIIPIIKSPGVSLNTQLKDLSVAETQEKDIESAALTARATAVSGENSPPFRIIPITVSSELTSVTNVDKSSPQESSSCLNGKLKEETTESEGTALVSTESSSALRSSVEKELADRVHDNDAVEQQSKDCLSEATESQAVSDELNSLAQRIDSPLDGATANSLCRSSSRALHSDDKMSSFISPAVVESNGNESPLTTGESGHPDDCLDLGERMNALACPNGKKITTPSENTQILCHNLQMAASMIADSDDIAISEVHSEQETNISSNHTQAFISAETKTRSTTSDGITNGVSDTVTLQGQVLSAGAISESDSNEDINKLDDEALMGTCVKRNHREGSQSRSQNADYVESKCLFPDDVNSEENSRVSQPVSSAFIKLEPGSSNPQQDCQRKITQCLVSNPPKSHQNGHHVPLHKGMPVVSQSSRVGGPFPPLDVRRGSGSSLLSDSISSSTSSSINHYLRDGQPVVRQISEFEKEHADFGSGDESDPLGDLEQYDEMPAGSYQSDSSDDLGSGWPYGSPPRAPMKRCNKNEEETGASLGSQPSGTSESTFYDHDHDGCNCDSLLMKNLYGLHKLCLSGARRESYQYSSYRLEDFENGSLYNCPERRIRNILLSMPVLLENVINGHFCSYVGINPYYLIHSCFQWTRIFALPEEDTRKIEKKLYVLFHRTQALITRNSVSVTEIEENFCSDSCYWAVANYLKKFQDQPTFQNIRQHCLGTLELMKLRTSFFHHSKLPEILDRNMKIEDFAINEEEFMTSQEAVPSYEEKDISKSENARNDSNERHQQSPSDASHIDQQEGADCGWPLQKDQSQGVAVNSLQLSPGLSGSSLSLLSDFMELCDNNKVKFSSWQEECDSDEDEEEEAIETYVDSVAVSHNEGHSYSSDSWAAVLSFCRVFRGELAYTAKTRKRGDGTGKNKLASWTCSGMDSHLSFSAWEEMDSLMKKLVPHISPRLDFQFLLRLYAEFKFFILKNRQRNRQRRGCFFIRFEKDVRCSKKEEFVFLKLLRDELRYFSHVIRFCKATELLFLEEHSVAYSLTRLLSLVLETLWKMNHCMRQQSAEGDNVEEADWQLDPTEPFSQLEDFDHLPESVLGFRVLSSRLLFHVANYKAFRTSSMWYDLPSWQQPSDFLDDPNLLQGNSSVFTHADNAIHVAQFGVYEDPKPLHEREGFTESMQQLRTREWYWGPLSYEQAILVLKDHRDGTFLVRDSSDKKYLLSISFTSLGEVHHTRIEHAKGLFSFWSQPDSHTKGSICEFIDISVQNSKDGRFLYFMRPSTRGIPPIPIRLLHPLSRNFRVPSLKHLSRFVIRQSVRIDLIRRLPLPQKVKAYLLEKQYFVEILLDDNWAFEREGSAS